MLKRTGIILINYKDYAKKFLAECRDSLREQSYPQEFFITYIVDNAGTDDSLKYLNEAFPEAIIITRTDGNYSAANNAGIQKAYADGCDYFIIANMDTRFEKDWLKELVMALESDQAIGVAQSKILLYPKDEAEWNHPRINSIGNIMHFLGFGFTGGYNQADHDINGLPEINGYASGCSFIIKREVIDKIGGYNEEFYMYHDDIELGWKVKLAGYKIILAPRSVVYHKYEFGRSILMLYYMERNRHLVLFIFYKIPTIILLLPAILVMELGMLFFSIMNGWFKTKNKIYKYFFSISTWKHIIRERKRVSQLRKVRDKDIVKNFAGKVLFQEINNPVLEYIANPLFNFYWGIAKRIIWW